MIIFINNDNIYNIYKYIVISINQNGESKVHCIILFIKGLCCAISVNERIKASENSGWCLPIKCALEIKDCYDHCTAEVTPENNEVEMTGAPATHAMA